jgi:hypothetical protein
MTGTEVSTKVVKPPEVVCTAAATQFYTAGQRYPVIYKENDEAEYVRGSDGILDNIKLSRSKFKPVTS